MNGSISATENKNCETVLYLQSPESSWASIAVCWIYWIVSCWRIWICTKALLLHMHKHKHNQVCVWVCVQIFSADRWNNVPDRSMSLPITPCSVTVASVSNWPSSALEWTPAPEWWSRLITPDTAIQHAVIAQRPAEREKPRPCSEHRLRLCLKSDSMWCSGSGIETSRQSEAPDLFLTSRSLPLRHNQCWDMTNNTVATLWICTEFKPCVVFIWC